MRNGRQRLFVPVGVARTTGKRLTTTGGAELSVSVPRRKSAGALRRSTISLMRARPLSVESELSCSALRATEIKALVLAELAFGIFADMTFLLFLRLAGRNQLHARFAIKHNAVKHHDLTRLRHDFGRQPFPSGHVAEFCDRARRAVTDANHGRDQVQEIRSDLLWMNSNGDDSRQLARQCHRRRMPIGRQTVMHLVEHEPMGSG